MKKLVSLILAIMMIAAVGAAFAATTTNDYSGVSQTTITGNSIPLVKSIVFFNPDNSYAVREPNITYSYTIAPADVTDATYTVNDGTNSAVVKDGVTGGVSATATITFADTTTVTASSSGVVKEESANLTVTPTAFTAPGIYRYIINETTTKADVEAYGIARDNDYVSSRYLDVYIRRNSTTDAMELYGAVIFRNTTQNVSITTASPTTKTEGFDTSVSSGYADDDYVDKYYTYNLEVGKTVSGSLADKNHDFPFSVTLTGTLTNAVTVDISNTGSGTVAATGSVSTTALTLSPSLSHGDKLTVKGIPSSTTAAVTETNDTYDTYTATATVQSTAATLDNDTTTKSIARSTTAALKTAASISTSTANDSIIFNNDITEVSPTGYVSRFAPYALILIGGVALLVIAMKKRKHTEED